MGQRATLKLKRILVCGDRKWNDPLLIYRALQEELELHGPFIVIEGEAPGADRMSRIAAESFRAPVRRFPADWKRYGRAAGPIRNKQMLDDQPDEVWAFHDNLERSKGTKNMVKIAVAAGITVRLFSHRSADKDVASLPNGTDFLSMPVPAVTTITEDYVIDKGG